MHSILPWSPNLLLEADRNLDRMVLVSVAGSRIVSRETSLARLKTKVSQQKNWSKNGQRNWRIPTTEYHNSRWTDTWEWFDSLLLRHCIWPQWLGWPRALCVGIGQFQPISMAIARWQADPKISSTIWWRTSHKSQLLHSIHLSQLTF